MLRLKRLENRCVCVCENIFFSTHSSVRVACIHMTTLNRLIFFMNGFCLKFNGTIYTCEKNHFRWKLKCYCRTEPSLLSLEDKQFPMNIWPGPPYLSEISECVPYWAYCSLLKEIFPCGNHFCRFQVDKCLPRGIRMHFYKTALKSNVCQLLQIKTSQSQFCWQAANALAMCKADWSGEAAYRLAGLISNLWQQYVSPCASSRLPVLNTNRGHSIYGNLCLGGEKKLKRWDWHFNLRAPLKICFSLIHYTCANYLSRRYKLDISKK